MITDLTPEEAGRRLDSAPAAVQEAVTGDATARVLAGVGKQYALHVDLVGQLVRLTSYLLVGYITPQQAQEELVSFGIDVATVRKILTDINQKIFVPLQEEMRKGQANVPPSAQAAGKPPLARMPHDTPSPPKPPVPEAPRAPWQAAPRPPVRFNESSDLPAPHAPITDPERELPVGEPPAPTAFSAPVFRQPPTTNHQPPPVPYPLAQSNTPASKPAFQSAPLPPRAVLPGAGREAPQTARPSAFARAIAPGAPAPWRAPKTAPPPPNLPGSTAPAPNPALSAPPPEKRYAADPYREPLE